MITTCTVCQARYQLDDDKVPHRVIRVRCPGCGGVFFMDGAVREDIDATAQGEPIQDTFAQDAPVPDNTFQASSNVLGSDQAPNIPATDPEIVQGASSDPFVSQPEASAEPVVEQKSDTTAAVADNLVTPVETALTESATEPAPKSRKRKRRAKEEMLARALVSDILVYNRELRDTSLEDGTLLESLGGEIKKSWELYKEKVTPEVANSTNYFREALNEILANGSQMF